MSPARSRNLSVRVIGITRYGRRILEFDHAPHRRHSPIIDKMGKVIIIETKSVAEYLRHLKFMGEDPAEYDDIWGYSLGVTEPRLPIFEYPPDAHAVTSTVTSLELVDVTAGPVLPKRVPFPADLTLSLAPCTRLSCTLVM